MELILEAGKQIWRTDETIVVRLLVLNESYEPVVVDRRLLVGPNLAPIPERRPLPVQVEPAFADQKENQIILNPWSLYGRQRTFSSLPVGQMTFYGYLLSQPVDALLPKGPVDSAALQTEAVPLVLTIQL